MKRWTGLLLCFLLITFFVVATSESQIVQSIEAAGTLFEDGTPIPVFRVTLTLRDLTKNTSVLITPKGKTKDTMRFISKDLVGTSVDEDMKLLDPEGNEANSFPILGDQSIRIMVLDDLSEGTFSFFEAPKTKAVYQTLLEESTASTVL
ncbi:MAG: hypothetical protein IJ088_10725, partial [Clostridia bacterium]|nr:hypothetical protein [Clostridia bacterium]